MTAVLGRLDRLEKQNRLWKGAALLTLLGFGAALLMGADKPPAKVNRFEDVQAKRFQLLDEKGKVRAQLVMSSLKQPALILYDEKGRERATVRLDKGGEAHFFCTDEGSVGRAVIRWTKDGPRFLCCDATGKVLSELGAGPKGGYVNCRDPDGELRFHAGRSHKPPVK
jgi:hypothetical protein